MKVRLKIFLLLPLIGVSSCTAGPSIETSISDENDSAQSAYSVSFSEEEALRALKYKRSQYEKLPVLTSADIASFKAGSGADVCFYNVNSEVGQCWHYENWTPDDEWQSLVPNEPLSRFCWEETDPSLRTIVFSDKNTWKARSFGCNFSETVE